MNALPDNVFVTGQILPDQLGALAEQGIKTLIINRPDMEAGPMQPTAAQLSAAAQEHGLQFAYIPMAGGISYDVIEASEAAFRDLPRPIVAFCAGGMRSAALWGFAHVKALGVDGVMGAIGAAGYNLEQIRGALEDYLNSKS